MQSSPLGDYSYVYDLDGRKTLETRSGGGLVTQTTSYVYDKLGRISQITLPSGTCRKYAYDLDSNRSQIQESPSGCAGSFSTTASYMYDQTNPNSPGLDQLTSVNQGGQTSYVYNTDGELTQRGSDTLSWDGWGRMTGGTFAGTTVSYGFDVAGNRRSRIAAGKTTHYLFAGSASPLFETDAAGAVTQTYADTAGYDLAHYSGPPTTGTTVSFLYDNAHGDLAAEANASGTRTAAYTYDPFGAPNDTVPPNSTTERWTGRWDKQLDTSTNLIQMGARPYDPNLGRFLTVDPVDGGSLNNYDYAGQDPINGYDLDGTMVGTADAGGCGGVAHNQLVPGSLTCDARESLAVASPPVSLSSPGSVALRTLEVAVTAVAIGYVGDVSLSVGGAGVRLAGERVASRLGQIGEKSSVAKAGIRSLGRKIVAVSKDFYLHRVQGVVDCISGMLGASPVGDWGYKIIVVAHCFARQGL
jgi:RHS repeat-associated protein